MPIGTAAAIGLGLAGVGSAVGAISGNKAAGKAADVSADVARENNALARDIYGQNAATLSPYVQRGNVAGDAYNALLGLPTAPQGQPNTLAQFGGYGATSGMPQEATMGVNDDAKVNALLGFGADKSGAAMRAYNDQNGSLPASDRLAWLYNRADPSERSNYDRWLSQQPTAMPQMQQQPGANMTGTVTASPQTYQSAFDNFRNSTGYQFRLGEGMNALNSGYAGAGSLKSGAAIKDAIRYGQDFASGEFGNYMGYLGNQQGVGLSGASALAGVGQNYANNVQANNNSAGTAQANALLYKGANNPFANMAGLVGGGLFGYGSR